MSEAVHLYWVGQMRLAWGLEDNVWYAFEHVTRVWHSRKQGYGPAQ